MPDLAGIQRLGQVNRKKAFAEIQAEAAKAQMAQELLADYAPRRRRQEDVVQSVLNAQGRAKGLKTWATEHPNFFLVHGYKVQVDGSEVVHCECKSWLYRGVCKHAAQVRRTRLKIA